MTKAYFKAFTYILQFRAGHEDFSLLQLVFSFTSCCIHVLWRKLLIFRRMFLPFLQKCFLHIFFCYVFLKILKFIGFVDLLPLEGF